ncbi:MAG: ATP-grasp domain-containing protein [Hyphomicrobiaceae bacterium]
MSDKLILLNFPDFDEELYFDAARTLGLEPVVFVTPATKSPRSSKVKMVQLSENSIAHVIHTLDDIGRDQIAGVLATGCTTAILAAEASAEIGRPNSNAQAIKICQDKFLARKKLAETGISDVGFAEAYSREEAFEAARRLGDKVVVKPRTAAGSNGARLVETPTAAADYFEQIAPRIAADPGSNSDSSNGVTIEEFVVGPQFNVEVFDGRAIVVSQCRIASPTHLIQVAVDTPAIVETRVSDEIAHYAEKVAAAVGYSRGIAHVEIRYSPKGPRLIEINPRIAGGVGPFAIKSALGIDLVLASMKFASGLPYTFEKDLTPNKSLTVATRFLVRGTEPVGGVSGYDRAKQIPGVMRVQLLPDRYHLPRTLSVMDRIGYVMNADADADLAVRGAEEALDALCVEPASQFQILSRRLRRSINKRLYANV